MPFTCSTSLTHHCPQMQKRRWKEPVTITSGSVFASSSQVFVKRRVIRLVLVVLYSCGGEADQRAAAMIRPMCCFPTLKGPSP